MTNAVYDMIVQSLSQKMSKIAAETMLQAVLKEKGLTGDSVSVSQMQEMLEGPLLGRLTAVWPPEQARAEAESLLGRLRSEFPKAPTLFTDVGAIWDDNNPDNPPEQTQAQASSQPQSWQEPFEFEEDDFEFDDPEYQAVRSAKQYNLSQSSDQESLIQELGRMQGIISIMITRDDGEMLQFKATREPTNIKDIISSVEYLFRKRLKLMSFDLDKQVICLRPLGEYYVAVVAGTQANIGRLLAELQQLEIK